MESILYASASYTPKNTGNFDLSKSTLFIYVHRYVGLTSQLQPLDVSINKPFRGFMKEKWNSWMQSSDFKRDANRKKAEAHYFESV
jgi:hypothetical protein